MAEERSWKSSLTAMEVAVLDVGLIIVAWLGSGMAFYYFCDEGWTPAYSVFFAVNVGLGVGYGEFMPTRPATKYFTSFYCLVGTSVVMGGLAVLFTGLQTKAKQASFTEPRHLKICGGYVEMKYRDIAFLVYFLLYAALIAVGIWIGYEYEGYTDFADALLFTVTNYTTSGLLQPKLGAGSLVGTTVSLLFGIPFNALFWGEVASRYFARIYRKKTCVDRGARKKTRSRAPAPPRRAPMKLRPARAIFSLCLSLDRYLEEKEATEVGSDDDASDASGSAGGAAAVPAALDDLDALAAGSEPGSPAAGAAAIADDPYVLFLHTELVKSGLVTKTHLGWLQSMYEVQQVSGGES